MSDTFTLNGAIDLGPITEADLKKIADDKTSRQLFIANHAGEYRALLDEAQNYVEKIVTRQKPIEAMLLLSYFAEETIKLAAIQAGHLCQVSGENTPKLISLFGMQLMTRMEEVVKKIEGVTR